MKTSTEKAISVQSIEPLFSAEISSTAEPLEWQRVDNLNKCLLFQDHLAK